MARKIIDIGAIGNDGTGDSIRDSFRKVNDNFRELYSSLGLGERLTFIGLDDTPETYIGNVNGVLAVNQNTDGVVFKQITGGTGVSVDQTQANEIIINSEFSDVSVDPSPSLGGPLNAFSGGERNVIGNLPDIRSQSEVTDAINNLTNIHGALSNNPDRLVTNKGYVDTKVSLTGVNTIDPATGDFNEAFGRMTGPLILSRDPEENDDAVYGGFIAATKRYVDNSAFGSSVNLYVATSGLDDRTGISAELQGRALAYAYRTIEAALKRAEEIVLESQLEIGPYKKVLTYNNGASIATLAEIATSPTSGTGFAGTVRMSVDTLTLINGGTNYRTGDTVTISGGAGTSATLEVLSTVTTPGAISSFRIISSGVYTALPGSTNITTTTDSVLGSGATFNITYKVNSVNITNGGTGYSLVSVRITPDAGDIGVVGAFGTAVVSAGAVTNIVITDPGSRFTLLPALTVDLPRFLIKTEGFRTDATGDVLTDTPEAVRGRDIREGLFLRGETSGALAQILAHDGALDSDGNEIFDVDILSGTFELDEVISYGDRAKVQQISVFIESGIYEENYPLKVPANVAIIGDEFRRTIIRPRPGTSSSPWAFQKFRRDLTIGSAESSQFVYDAITDTWELEARGGDQIQIADRLFGHHYLSESSSPVYPKINNPGSFTSAAALVALNREFLQNEVIAWINEQITSQTAPFTSLFTYDNDLWKKDIGLILDSMVFDLRYGEYNRTISTGLKYRQSPSGVIAITTQLSETVAAINHLETLILDIIANIAIDPVYNLNFSQIINPSFIAESGSDTVLGELFDSLTDVLENSGSVNYPKDNDDLDVFLCNDAVIIRAVTCQGHGGFMMVLDPQGQILAKSPYCQESACFSKSINAQTFAGGMYVDGFTGNLQFLHEASPTTTRISVSGLDRFPQLPASFIVDDQVYRINYVRDFVYDPNGSSATFVLDETAPFTKTPGAQTCTISVGDPAVITRNDHGLQPGSTIKFSSTGTLPTGIVAGREYYVSSANITANTFRISGLPGSDTLVETTGAGSGTHSYQRLYEVLMPGNRSMLSNDFTQVNDLGYGLVVANGGLTEAVSMFTYYNHISYYASTGGQIRSVGGSSAHGNYALVAEGADPLEIPTPTDLYYDLSQSVKCFNPGGSFRNLAGGLTIFVTDFDYDPQPNSELEVDHGNQIFRYPVTSVNREGLPAGVVRLNLTSDETGNFDGLFDEVPDDQKLTLRMNSTIILTGGLEDVAVRPSTGLVLNESTEVYRVIQFSEYTDPVNTDYDLQVTTGDPGEFAVLITVNADGSSNVVASERHGLRQGDEIKTTSNVGSSGLSPNTSYYVGDVAEYNEFDVVDINGNPITVGAGSVQFIKAHELLVGYTITFASSTGVSADLPDGLTFGETYYVVEDGLTDFTFQVAAQRNGNPIEIISAGTGTIRYSMVGLTQTNLRENYNYIDLTIFKPGEFVGATTDATISIGASALFTTAGSHGLNVGDVIALTTTGQLPTGLSIGNNYFVFSTPTANTFTVSLDPPVLGAAVEVTTTGSQSGTHSFGLVTGRAGDDAFAVIPVAPEERARIPNSRFVFNGEEYVINQYESEADTGESYARITLNRPLEESIIDYSVSYTIKSAVQVRTNNAKGTLTIRISLVRVTSHDLLEIGTGGYADTNYPNEINGAPVNSFDEAKEYQERDVGRVFFVTTDQFGNFKVGPYFKVDQGTGTVTFAASIALSNLDGLGFKRGVPVAEFSVDSTFSDNAIDTVPTENATRIYLERRLGLTHTGSVVASETLIPTVSGGFMALDGQLAMKSIMDLGDNKIINIADPTTDQDAVNLRSLTIANIQDFSIDNINSNQILVFTGNGNEVINANVVGDVAIDIDSTANTVDIQINPDTIIDSDIKTDAAIVQSKLAMNAATTRANATGIAQADLGLASFDDAQFTATDGWITVKNNGLVIEKIEQITGKSVLGNELLTAGNVSEVLFTTVVNDGGALKKSQFSSTGFIRRNSSGSFALDGDYSIIESSSAYGGASDNSKIITRDSNGDFGARVATFSQVVIDGRIVLDSETAVDGLSGFNEVFAWDGAGGLILSNGDDASERKNQYRNDSHEFQTQNGSNPAPISCSQITTTAITTGGQTTPGTVTGRWSLVGTSRFEATYSADLAEYYEGDQEYEIGTVLIFGGDKEVTTTTKYADTKVAGVVSDNAAYSMYGACPGLKNLVALQGRVPVKVVGKIQKGDLITTSEIEGVACAVLGDAKTGTIIGKALKDYNSTDVGIIEVAVGRS